ncbi:putative multiple sugar transport system substrate-binding protein [Curtobacterium flaccumfaciens]|uniref:Multiple sugar transport system substrate-binding protein n=1 Tax=Curtobacterium salicis TaxID=1779862 RepID=A0ABX0T676_9MICO|nr:sugar-binding protein [Curtobacterium sp. WW7]NII40976.1 putative multiple sugar transport system substrate-binding protein [Curtobacterium sp. WW7]
MRKKIVAGVSLALIAGLALSGCSARGNSDGSGSGSGSSSTIKKGDLIGVALPAKTSQNWVLAGAAFKKSIEKAGFKADIQYANAGSPVPDQQSQISGMVTKGAKAVIIGAADGSQLGSQVKAAKSAGATVIAWDRNILNTENVDYYVAFNNFKVGQLQAQALLKGLGEKKGDKPYNVEIFAGSPDDANATVFFNGAMDVLQPKIDDGTIKVVSGQTSFQKVATQGWLAQKAQSRMTDLLAQYYTGDTELDGVLSPNDTLARAILTATKAAGKDNPVVTGQDSETASIPLIMQGTQYSTIYKNTTDEAQAAIDLVSDLADGKKPKTVSDKNNDNGKKIVPTVELTPVLVTKDNAVEAYSNDETLEALAKKG